MADEKAFSDEQLAQLTGVIDTRLTAQFTELTNKYDKNLEKHISKRIDPVVEDMRSQITKGLKPKKLAKLMRRLEEAKAGKKNKDGKEKTAEELAAEAAAIAAAEKDKKDKKKKDGDGDDMFKRRQAADLDARIKSLEDAKVAAEAIAAAAQLESALDRALSDFPWANTESRDMARQFYLPKLKRNDDDEIMIGDQKFDLFIKAEIPAKYENLLAPAGKGGSGINKGSGKAGSVDVDALTAPGSTPAQKAEASMHVAKLMGA